MRVVVFCCVYFNVVYWLYNFNWSDEKNQEVFGLCNNFNYYGYNYELEVKVSGEVDFVMGYLIDLKVFKDIIKE